MTIKSTELNIILSCYERLLKRRNNPGYKRLRNKLDYLHYVSKMTVITNFKKKKLFGSPNMQKYCIYLQSTIPLFELLVGKDNNAYLIKS